MHRSMIQSDPSVFRPNFVQAFDKLLMNLVLSMNIEKGIYNYTIREANLHQIIKKWKNPQFCEIYCCRLKSLLQNLTSYPTFLHQVKEGQISPEQLTNMTHQEMCPEQWKSKIEKKMKIDQSHFSTNIEASTDMFTCKKCKSKRCTYYEMQTRSADEPATIFITCLDCGKCWKN